jgi:hypothetical protein
MPGIEQAALGAGAAAQVQIELGQVACVAMALQQSLGGGEDADRALQCLRAACQMGFGQHRQILGQASQQWLQQAGIGMLGQDDEAGLCIQSGGTQLGLGAVARQKQLGLAAGPLFGHQAAGGMTMLFQGLQMGLQPALVAGGHPAGLTCRRASVQCQVHGGGSSSSFSSSKPQARRADAAGAGFAHSVPKAG